MCLQYPASMENIILYIFRVLFYGDKKQVFDNGKMSIEKGDHFKIIDFEKKGKEYKKGEAFFLSLLHNNRVPVYIGNGVIVQREINDNTKNIYVQHMSNHEKSFYTVLVLTYVMGELLGYEVSITKVLLRHVVVM